MNILVLLYTICLLTACGYKDVLTPPPPPSEQSLPPSTQPSPAKTSTPVSTPNVSSAL